MTTATVACWALVARGQLQRAREQCRHCRQVSSVDCADCRAQSCRILTTSDGDGTTRITRSLAAARGAACAVWWTSSLPPSCISPYLSVSVSPSLAVVRAAGWRDSQGQCDSWSEKDQSRSSPISRWFMRGCSQDAVLYAVLL